MTTREEILTAAMQLPEDDRLAIAGQLLATVPDELVCDWDDEEFLDELERRAGDLEGNVPADQLWQQIATQG
jgi:hypothetical protein